MCRRSSLLILQWRTTHNHQEIMCPWATYKAHPVSPTYLLMIECDPSSVSTNIFHMSFLLRVIYQLWSERSVHLVTLMWAATISLIVAAVCPGGPSLCPYTSGFSWLTLNVILTLKLRPRTERNAPRGTLIKWQKGYQPNEGWQTNTAISSRHDTSDQNCRVINRIISGIHCLKGGRPLYNSWVVTHQNNFLPNSANTKPGAHTKSIELL